MIKFSLACTENHSFEAWFGSSAAFDEQQQKGLITCPVCGSAKVEKSLMAPSVTTSRKQESARAEVAAHMVQGLRAIREHVEANATDVGQDFAKEARKIHYGEVAPKGIYGSANKDDVEELLEEGIEIAPLPMLPEDAN
ncbi:MAG: DUF1178 family protein [Pseudomonadota bacterium]